MIKINCAHDAVVDIGDLVPHPKNSNKHPDKQIEFFGILLEEHGWRLPICVSNQSGYIVRGHLRYYTALKLGEGRVPVDFQDYENEVFELADLTADNRIPEMAERDEQLLNELLTEIRDMPDVDIQITGYTDQDLEKMTQSLEKRKKDKPEVEFSEELHESSNYIVLYFNNDIDWLQALTLFDLKTVKALDSKEGFQKQGIGRVLNGSEALNKIMGE
jgi:hypothetical protein